MVERAATIAPDDQQRSPFMRLWDGWTTIILLLFLAAVVLLDAFALPALISFFRDDPLYFIDVCTGSETQSAGKFALALTLAALFLVTGLASLGLRSPIAGISAFVTILIMQLVVGASGGLRSVLSSVPFGLDWAARVCPDPSQGEIPLSYRLQQAYNPGPAGSLGGDLDSRFTDMLAVNLFLIGVAAPLILLVIAGIRRLISVTKSPSKRSEGPIPEPLPFLRGPERTMIVQNALAVVALIAAGPLALLVLAEGGNDASKPVWDLLWAGPFILIMDTARLMLVPAKAAKSKPASRDIASSGVSPVLVLPTLAQTLSKKFHAEVVRSFEIPPSPGVARAEPLPPPIAPQTGHGRYLFGTLKTENYNEILTCLNEGILDRGRAALVICPSDSLDHFAEEILTRIGNGASLLEPRCWISNRQLPDEPGAVEIIFTSPELLSEVLDQLPEIGTEIATLGGVIAIGLHRMDVGLLHLGLRRLSPLIENPGKMIALVQSEQRGNLSNYVRHLPLFDRLPDSNDHDSPDLDRRGPGLTLILKNGTESGFENANQWPIWVRSIIEAHKAEKRADVYVFDTQADFPVALWTNKVVATLKANTDQDLTNWAGGLRHSALLPVDATHPVALIEDTGNLADALRIGIADTSALESLRLIVTADYPGSGFLRAELGRAWREGSNNGQIASALTHFCEVYGSQMPKPQGGPIELALLVRQEYTKAVRQRPEEGGHLRQDALDRLWADRTEPLEQLGISNTRIGLERLFRQAFPNVGRASFVTRTEGADRRWQYTLADQSLTTSDTLINYPIELQQSGTLPGTSKPGGLALPAADHGLSYAKNVRVAVAGDIYKVREVNSSRRSILVELDNDRPVKPHVFVRDYAVQLDPGDGISNFAADDRNSIQNTNQPFEIATGYAHVARRTVAHLENSSSNAPFGADESAPKRTEVDIETGFRLRSIGILRSYLTNHTSTGAGQPPRHADLAGPTRGSRILGGRGLGRRPTGKRTAGTVRRGSAIGYADGKLAFTLATTLQDVLGLMFQPIAHRIAVLSPDALLLPPLNQGGPDRVVAYCLDRQPAIARDSGSVPSSNTGRHATSRHQSSNDVQAAYNKFVDAFMEQARVRKSEGPNTEATHISLLIIEDSDHDLGVVRFFNDSPNKVLTVWSAYLAHYAGSWGGKSVYDYSFGTPHRPDCYDFKAAADYVAAMQ